MLQKLTSDSALKFEMKIYEVQLGLNCFSRKSEAFARKHKHIMFYSPWFGNILYVSEIFS